MKLVELHEHMDESLVIYSTCMSAFGFFATVQFDKVYKFTDIPNDITSHDLASLFIMTCPSLSTTIDTSRKDIENRITQLRERAINSTTEPIITTWKELSKSPTDVITLFFPDIARSSNDFQE